MSTTIHLHPGWELSSMLSDLREAKNETSTCSKLIIYNLEIDVGLAGAIQELLVHEVDIKPNKWKKIEMLGCTGRVDSLITCMFTTRNFQLDELVLEHSHIDHYDVSVYAALGMGLSLNTGCIVSLRLYQPDLDRLSIWALGQGLRVNRYLQTLDLTSCRLDVNDGVVEMLAASLSENSHLVTILLNDCELKDEHVENIARALGRNPTLKSLELYRNKCRSRGMAAIAALLMSSNCALENLNLQCQRVSGGQRLLDPSLDLLEKSLKNFSNLVTLNISDNKLNDQDIDFLVCAFAISSSEGQHHRCLQSLNLSNNFISDRGVQKLADEMRSSLRLPSRFYFLKTLQLDNNNITDVGAKLLGSVMCSNIYMEELTFGNSQIAFPSAVLSDIQYHCCLNKGGRKLLQADNVPLSLWPRILERPSSRIDLSNYSELKSASVDIVYYLLLQGPALFEQRSYARDLKFVTTYHIHSQSDDT